MSDKSESFEEWCKLNGFCSSYVPEKAWSHQQEKIDELRISNARLFSDNGDMRIQIQDSKRKLQAAEENLTECAAKYWKEVETRKAAEEENKILREAVDKSLQFLISVGAPQRIKNKLWQALDKVGGGE